MSRSPDVAPEVPPDEAAGDAAEARRWRVGRLQDAARFVLPIVVLGLAVAGWDWVVAAYGIPHYVLPGPRLVWATLIDDWPVLSAALLNTVIITAGALAVAAVGGLALAVAFTASRWVELSLFPLAVVLQVTPIIAIAPLIFIYVESVFASLLLCTFIVAFFPVLANASLGLNSADHNLHDLFRLHRASRWQALWLLRLPAALPYYLGGVRIAGGLALIGAIVAEFTAGTAGAGSGLASRILEAGYRLNMPRLFAALILISATGIAIFLVLSLISHLVLRRWHESAARRPV
jgi:NitT/TauT family transport system permease protein